MVTYRYRCSGCGPFDLALPMGEGAAERPCGECGAAARRVFTAPSLTRPGNPLTRALDASNASAHEPRVVSRPAAGPGPLERPRPAAPSDPRHALLPRP
ncbi:FmdB family zinc ribbon protein [Actinomadura rubrisoli]|uniref:Zinc ribbon domain-containing protein n=1 Tax=Actinomadura rubrisoli TaxID=2530368 RepID=A0A4R5AEM7_9ACTN|nr:FmdB family zinc ribbon protein [Actinomadura rubrisoli]TDD69770.1 zinc ribbon domain-containing protein [Actinomadura rubrisoli]